MLSILVGCFTAWDGRGRGWQVSYVMSIPPYANENYGHLFTKGIHCLLHPLARSGIW